MTALSRWPVSSASLTFLCCQELYERPLFAKRGDPSKRSHAAALQHQRVDGMNVDLVLMSLLEIEYSSCSNFQIL